MHSEFLLAPSERQQQAGMLEGTGTLMEKINRSKRSVGVFVFLLAAGSVGLGYLSFLSAGALIFLLQMVGFFALGYLHASVLQTNVAQFSHAQKVLYTFILGGVLVISLTAFFYFLGISAPLFIGASGCFFVWPHMVNEAARLFSEISAPPTAAWQYDPNMPLQKSTTFLNSIPVRFRVLAGQLGEEGRIVHFRAPVRMKMGLIFYHTVQDQNSRTESAIQLLSPDNEPYAWIFTVATFGGVRYLDPELSLVENGVKENTLITAKRVQA